MTYNDLRPLLHTGDLLLVQGAWWIRVATGESVSHVGLVLRRGSGVWVADYTWRSGYRVVPASQWLAERAHRRLWWGRAPLPVRAAPQQVLWQADRWRADPPPYAWWELPAIWWHQLLGRPYRARGPQCHSYVYTIWRAAGYAEPPPRDPGDYLSRCDEIRPVEV